MAIVFALIAAGMMMIPFEKKEIVSTSAVFECQQVCLMNQGHSLVAVNPTRKTVAVVLQVQRIENVVLAYRYPFVEFLGPQSSKVLLTYQVSKAKRPYAFDYDWHWRQAL